MTSDFLIITSLFLGLWSYDLNDLNFQRTNENSDAWDVSILITRILASSSERRSKTWRHTTVCWIFARFEAVGERSRSFASRSYWHFTARWSHNSQDMLCSTKDIASLHFFELGFAKVGYLDDFSGSVFGWEETSHNYVKSFVHRERCLHKVFTISSTHVKCKRIVVPAPHSTNTEFVPTGGVLERRAMVPKADFLFGTTDFGETPTTLVADGIVMAIFRRIGNGPNWSMNNQPFDGK